MIDISFGGGQEQQVATGVYLCKIKGVRTVQHRGGNWQVVIDALVKPTEEALPDDYLRHTWYVFFRRENGTGIKAGCLVLQSLAASTGHAKTEQLDPEKVAGQVVQVGLEFEHDPPHKPKNVPRVFAPKGQVCELPAEVLERAAEHPFIDPSADAEPGDDPDLEEDHGF